MNASAEESSKEKSCRKFGTADNSVLWGDQTIVRSPDVNVEPITIRLGPDDSFHCLYWPSALPRKEICRDIGTRIRPEVRELLI